MKQHLYRTVSLVVFGATLAAQGDGVLAQATIALEEITVTARRQEENLMEIPMAVSVMTAER